MGLSILFGTRNGVMDYFFSKSHGFLPLLIVFSESARACWRHRFPQRPFPWISETLLETSPSDTWEWSRHSVAFASYMQGMIPQFPYHIIFLLLYVQDRIVIHTSPVLTTKLWWVLFCIRGRQGGVDMMGVSVGEL